ncbi:TorF family putative porin [Mucisphaera calidilacus]|uniref:Uncharacterized protein n=1 Tax=Mucisphaera calidilacus TaxID=2527982 RepID=A0A518BXM8_9BACT|nr:TorF family putative porin [Mucisphaera calidilacus]QDU71732.1 Bacterial protein of unknown function (Gcw_chp) [Mucisphaera calidilacus]
MSTIKNLTTAGLAASALALGLTTSTAMAQEEGPAINTGAISLEASIDFTHAYFYRGIAQENSGFIIQPGLEVGIALYENDSMAVSGYVGTWNSFHTNDSATGGDPWYEQDVYVGLTFDIPAGVSIDLAYVNLYAPNAGASFAEEINVTVSFDDSELLGDLALNPYVLMSFEIDGASDGDGDSGIYLEIGTDFALEVLQSEDYPITVSVPVAVGFGVSDYYGGRDGLGFVSVAVVGETPLSFIPAEYGEWSASAGLELLFMTMRANDLGAGVIGSSDLQPILKAGISLSY